MIKLNGKEITYTKFPGGEVQGNFEKLYDYLDDITSDNTSCHIEANITSSEEVFVLAQLKDALDRISDNEYIERIYLLIPYLPYARYDRPMHELDSHSLKVFCNLINSLNFYKVIIHDCHSDVGFSLLDRCINITQAELFKEFRTIKYNLPKFDYIIAPDNGATKKASKIANDLGHIPLITCMKERDLFTGKIIKYRILDEITKPGKALIVDDICDGGATFNILAKSLKEDTQITNISLYVTHGIFSKGVDTLLENIDHIYCYHSWIKNNHLNK